jgi:pimeloyl-ACP methyl ester carboxylesterase
MAVQAKFLLKLAVLFGLLVFVVPTLVGGWFFWKRPLTVDAWMSRLALSKSGFEASVLETPAGDMTVWEGGTGPVMVMLHGAGDHAGAWARSVGMLVDSHQIVVPDLPGHWKSDPRTGAIHIRQVLDGLSIVMEKWSASEPAILVGNSMGAWVAFLYAREHPGRVARLVAVNGGPIRQDNPAVNLFPANRDEARETLRGLFGPNTLLPPGFVLDDVVRHSRTGPAARFAEPLIRSPQELEAHLLDGRLDEVTVPVDLVWGDADALFTMDYAQRLLDGLPAARLTPVEDCGHVPHRECPDRFIAALEAALELPPAVAETTATEEEP